jgi:hypothetical protein
MQPIENNHDKNHFNTIGLLRSMDIEFFSIFKTHFCKTLLRDNKDHFRKRIPKLLNMWKMHYFKRSFARRSCVVTEFGAQNDVVFLGDDKNNQNLTNTIIGKSVYCAANL